MASEKDATCENDPNFAVVCAFFQKFSHMLNIQYPDFYLLQQWLENTDEVPEGLKLLHIKLLRKLRKTVHEKAWETALSKFCFGYSAQDAWEIERFGYKKSSLKVKLRILKELVESQFQRNGKFRNTFTAMNAAELRSQPVGKDKLGHSYWLTQDPNLNLRIYQEHLDEEIWQMVASNREELVTLINRLKGNEVVLPSLVGVVDEDSSNSSYQVPIKEPPPEEKENESQEEFITNNEAKVPNIKIKLDTFTIKRETNFDDNENGDLIGGEITEGEDKIKEENDERKENIKKEILQTEMNAGDKCDDKQNQKLTFNKILKQDEMKSDTCKIDEKINTDDSFKSMRKISIKTIKGNRYVTIPDSENKCTGNTNSEDEIENVMIKTEKTSTESDEKPVINDETKDSQKRKDNVHIEAEEESVKASKMEERESRKRSISELIGHIKNTAMKKSCSTLIENTGNEKFSKYEKYSDEDSRGEEETEDEDACDDVSLENNVEKEERSSMTEDDNEEECENISDSIENDVGEPIEEDIMIIKGEGYGKDCLVGNSQQDTAENSKFYFGQPGCLQLNPIKKVENVKHMVKINVVDSDSIKMSSEIKNYSEDLKNDEKSNDKLSSDKEDESKDEKIEEKEIDESEKTSTSYEKELAKAFPNLGVLPIEVKQDEYKPNKSSEKEELDFVTKTVPAPQTVFSETSLIDDRKCEVECRKRRLSSDIFEKRNQLSESETDINSENVEEPDELEIEERLIGGKKPKIRCKLLNTEIRKRIEAKRNFIEKETSSSSEAELPKKKVWPRKFEAKMSSVILKDPKLKTQNTHHVVTENESALKKEHESKSDWVEMENTTQSEVSKLTEKEGDIKEDDEEQNATNKTDSAIIEKDIQSPSKATRSTRSSVTEPLFQDLPQPKRKARVGSRKSITPKTIKGKAKQKKLHKSIEPDENEDKELDTQTVVCPENPKEINSLPPEIKEIKEEIQNNEEVGSENEEKVDLSLIKTNGSNVKNESNSTEMVKLENSSTNEHSEKNDESNKTIEQTPKKKQRRTREIDESNIIDPEAEVAPVRQSRRIAQLKLKEEAERRKLEEIALKKMKEELKKKKKEESKLIDQAAVPLSDHSKDSSKEEDSEVDLKKKVEKKRKKRVDWSSNSESEPEEEEEDLMFDHHESDRGSPNLKSDHEFSPESELEDNSEVVPLKRARTARKEGEAIEKDVEDDQACQKCGKKDHPEWILLCDNCDKGYHCSCLSPVLFIIPEGDWFCPPCQQEQLISTLEDKLKEFDDLLNQRKEDEIKKQLALKAAQEAEEEEKEARRARNIQKREMRNRKRYSHVYSDDNEDEEDDDDNDDDDEEDEDEEEERTKKRRRAVFSSRSYTRLCSSTSDLSRNNSNSSQSTDSDNEPIYKLRKRRQINVSYRFNEFDDLINSAIKEEMDEVAGAGNLGRGKDISTIIEADKEEKLRIKHLEEEAAKRELHIEKDPSEPEDLSKVLDKRENVVEHREERNDDSGSDFEPLKTKSKINSARSMKKKKSRKLNCLDISSDDDGSDEDFKTSPYETEEDEESLSVSSESESSLEVFKNRIKTKKPKKTRRAARRAARNQRKQYDSDFVVDDTDVSEEFPQSKKKRKEDSDYSASLTDEDELSEEVDSDELCDDSTNSDESDGAWKPKKNKKQKSVSKPQKRKVISSGKYRKIKRKDEAEKSFKVGVSKNKIFDDEDSLDSGRRTRGKRFTYLEDYEEESSDDGIKPGVKRPDTPPEEREQFIRKQEEIKRMLAEKNAEAAKVVATPTLTPILNSAENPSSVVETTDSLSTVPLSVIKGAKALDIDYLQRKGELEKSDEEETDFDDDLPDDFNPEEMDEETIAKMMEEEELGQQQVKLTAEAIQKKKTKEVESSSRETELLRYPRTLGSVLQEPPRKRLPIPTIQPPLRNTSQNRIQHLQTISRTSLDSHQSVPHSLAHPPSRIIPSPAAATPISTVSHIHEMQSQTVIQQSNEASKPRGRRKKITPLRDTLQKQQAAAASTVTTTVKASVSPTVNTTKDSFISNKVLEGIPIGSNLSIAQPPQLYKSPSNVQQSSVITRMPQPPQDRFSEQSSRFYPSPSQLLHRTSTRLPAMPMSPHTSLRLSYASESLQLRATTSNGSASSVSIKNGIPRHPSPFSNSDQYPRSRQPTIHPPYRPPLYGTPGYPPAPPQQLPPSSQLSPHLPSQRHQPSAHQQTTPQHIVPHHLAPQPTSVLHTSSSNVLHPGTNSYPGPFGNYFASHSASPLTGTHSSSSLSATTAAVPSSVIVSPQTIAATPVTNTISPSISTAPVVEPDPVRPKASPLETFNSKSNQSSLEAESTQSPYSSNEPVGDNDDEGNAISSNITSEFSGLVSYFSSQRDDLNT